MEVVDGSDDESSDATPAKAVEKENGERGPSRRRDRWGRNRNGRNRGERNGAESEINGHSRSVVTEAGEPTAERPVPVRQDQPVAPAIEIMSQPVEVRKWQPPAPTVLAEEVPKKPKVGWWSKRS